MTLVLTAMARMRTTTREPQSPRSDLLEREEQPKQLTVHLQTSLPLIAGHLGRRRWGKKGQNQRMKIGSRRSLTEKEVTIGAIGSTGFRWADNLVVAKG
jgi:hypothetical protein